MKALMIAAALSLAGTAGALAAPKIGEAAPAFSATDSNGKPVALSDFAGKTVVLEWTNHDCPYVVKHYKSGNMQGLQSAAAKDGVVWLSVISSAPGKQGHVDGAAANALTESRKAAPAHVLLDAKGDIGRAYDAKTTPHMYVIDAKGTLAYMGGIDDKKSTKVEDIAGAKNFVSLALADLAAGKTVGTTQSDPYGCSVKY